MHSFCAVLAARVARAGDFSGGVADFVAFPPRRNCNICFIRVFTCPPVFAGQDSRLQTVLLLIMSARTKTVLAKNSQAAHVFGSLAGGLQLNDNSTYNESLVQAEAKLILRSWFTRWHGPCVKRGSVGL